MRILRSSEPLSTAADVVITPTLLLSSIALWALQQQVAYSHEIQRPPRFPVPMQATQAHRTGQSFRADLDSRRSTCRRSFNSRGPLQNTKATGATANAHVARLICRVRRREMQERPRSMTSLPAI